MLNYRIIEAKIVKISETSVKYELLTGYQNWMLKDEFSSTFNAIECITPQPEIIPQTEVNGGPFSTLKGNEGQTFVGNSLAEPQPKFKVGDSVRIVTHEDRVMHFGEEGRIIQEDNTSIPYLVDVKGRGRWMYESDLELIEQPNEPKIATTEQIANEMAKIELLNEIVAAQDDIIKKAVHGRTFNTSIGIGDLSDKISALKKELEELK
jgi:hypothetical protein